MPLDSRLSKIPLSAVLTADVQNPTGQKYPSFAKKMTAVSTQKKLKQK